MKLESLNAELRKVERRRAQLEQQIKAQADVLYRSLPGKVGLKSVDALVLVLAPYASPAIRQKLHGSATEPSRAAPSGTTSVKTSRVRSAKASRTRERHSDEKKAAIRGELQKGKLTIKQIATRHGVPSDTLKKWKRRWGLTSASRSRK